MKWYAVGTGGLWWIADDATTDSEARVSDNMSLAAADTVALKHNRTIADLESKLDACQSSREWLQTQNDVEQKHSRELQSRLDEALAKLTKVMGHPSVSLSTAEAIEAERDAALARLDLALNGLRECEKYIEAVERVGLPAHIAALREITSPILYPAVERRELADIIEKHGEIRLWVEY